MRKIIVLMSILTGCSEDRKALQLPVEHVPSAASLALEGGVTVELSAALLTVADLQLEAPAETARARTGWSLISTAHAHPGHDAAGELVGELAGSFSLDLLGEGSELGVAQCYEGELATASLTLLSEPAAVVEGTATVGTETRAFSFVLAPEQDITGITLSGELDAERPPRALVYAVDLAQALSAVDWSTPDEDADGLLTTADGELANTVAFGLNSTPTHSLTLDD